MQSKFYLSRKSDINKGSCESIVGASIKEAGDMDLVLILLISRQDILVFGMSVF